MVDLLTDLSADGNVTREEMDRLRAWLEVDRSVDFPAMSFLYETIDQISADGEITEDELDLLASRLNGYYRRTYGRLRQPSAGKRGSFDESLNARWPVRR